MEVVEYSIPYPIWKEEGMVFTTWDGRSRNGRILDKVRDGYQGTEERARELELEHEGTVEEYYTAESTVRSEGV
jgi:hypothetical protein